MGTPDASGVHFKDPAASEEPGTGVADYAGGHLASREGTSVAEQLARGVHFKDYDRAIQIRLGCILRTQLRPGSVLYCILLRNCTTHSNLATP